MSKKLKVKKLVIETDDVELSLTVEQAKDLYKELGELFGDKTVIINRAPSIVPRNPYWREPWITWKSGQISSQSLSGLSVTYSGTTT